MGGEAKRTIRWLSRWGFAALVALGAAVAVCMAATATVPAEVPSFALRAASVYRLEVGLAFFVSLYLGAMALALALHNRAFSEIGTDGIRAHGIGEELRVRQRLEALLHSAERIQAENKKSQGSEGYNESDDN